MAMASTATSISSLNTATGFPLPRSSFFTPLSRVHGEPLRLLTSHPYLLSFYFFSNTKVAPYPHAANTNTHLRFLFSVCSVWVEEWNIITVTWQRWKLQYCVTSIWEPATETLLWQSMSPCFGFASIHYCQWVQRCHYQPSGIHSDFSSPEINTLFHLFFFLISFLCIGYNYYAMLSHCRFWKSYFILKCLRWPVEVVFNFLDMQCLKE